MTLSLLYAWRARGDLPDLTCRSTCYLPRIKTNILRFSALRLVAVCCITFMMNRKNRVSAQRVATNLAAGYPKAAGCSMLISDRLDFEHIDHEHMGS